MGHVFAIALATGQVVSDYGFVPGSPDGIVEGTGAAAGDLFLNTNSGTVVELNLATRAQTVIASGGSRGDFAAAGPGAVSAFLTQTDSVVRLTFPPGRPIARLREGPGRAVAAGQGLTQGAWTVYPPEGLIPPAGAGDPSPVGRGRGSDSEARPSVPPPGRAVSDLAPPRDAAGRASRQAPDGRPAAPPRRPDALAERGPAQTEEASGAA
jgi:hypothetical protein